jgi:dipeptidyl aminopeptidase/acylaminoacyl peptidase
MSSQIVARPVDPDLLVYGRELPLDPQVSPDGARILYRAVTADRDPDAARSRLVTCAWDGTDVRPLTAAGHLDALARWSPDGGRVAFVSDRAEPHGIFVVPAGGGEPRELTRHRSPIAGLAWSPDGTRIAYTCRFDPANPDEAEEDRRGPAVRVARRPDYKLDGVGFIGEARSQVFVVDVASGRRERLTGGPDDHALPQWSPDGRRFAAMAGPYFRARLAVVDAETGDATLVGPEGGQLPLWSWSPSGDRLLLAADPARSYQLDFYLHDVATGETSRLTDDPGVNPHVGGIPVPQPPSMPVWLDERSAVFSGVRAGACGLYRLDCDTGQVEMLRRWQAIDASFTADRSGRRFAFARSSLERQGEIVTLDRRTDEIASVAGGGVVGAAWERFDVHRGGETVEAWLLKPPGFDASHRYPVVLDIHGGPNSWYGYGFVPHQQVLAAGGFVVVFANPRGSGSYGRRFAGLVLRDWGGEDHRDLMAVVDAVLERPYVDPERLGIFGYSYGGYMTSWTIGHTDRFRAAVVGAPCFDLESHWGSSDIGHAWDDVQWGGPPHERPDWYRQRSPSTFAHGIRTPTLVLQGEADDRCPVGQGHQLYTALHDSGCETELALYPGASHLFFVSPDGRPSQRADFLARTLGWFREHV